MTSSVLVSNADACTAFLSLDLMTVPATAADTLAQLELRRRNHEGMRGDMLRD
jgi:hypothetical protein